MGRSRRTIPEELLLLALDPATGTTAQPQSLDLGLAGAQLVELALAGRIAPDGDRIAVVMPRPTGDPTLDSALELLICQPCSSLQNHWLSVLLSQSRSFWSPSGLTRPLCPNSFSIRRGRS